MKKKSFNFEGEEFGFEEALRKDEGKILGRLINELISHEEPINYHAGN